MAMNVKGIIFGGIGSLVGLIIGNKVTDVLNEHYNPELMAAKQEEKDCIMNAINHVTQSSTDVDIVDTTATEAETPG